MNDESSSEASALIEPRAVTLHDWLLIVVGVAIAWSLPNPFSFPPQYYSTGLVIWILFVRATLSPAYVVTCVVVGRQFRYGRVVCPAEWLAIVLVAWQLVWTLPSVDDVINAMTQESFEWFGIDRNSMDWSTLRWGSGATCLMLSGVLLGILGFRRHLSNWTCTLLWIAVLTLLIWGPLAVLEQERPWPFTFKYTTPAAFHQELHLAIIDRVYEIAFWLTLTIPLMATIRSWHDKRWIWTEWISVVVTGLLTAVVMMTEIQGFVSQSLSQQIADAVALLLCLVTLSGLAWAVIGCARSATTKR